MKNVAQSVDHQSANPKVMGSVPTRLQYNPFPFNGSWIAEYVDGSQVEITDEYSEVRMHRTKLRGHV